MNLESWKCSTGQEKRFDESKLLLNSTTSTIHYYLISTMDSSRNIYKNGIDFTTLALQSPEFAKQWASFTWDWQIGSLVNKLSVWKARTSLTSAILNPFSKPTTSEYGPNSEAKPRRQLAKSLLQRDFGLSLELPPDRLCPPVRRFEQANFF
jgi:23S rRNA (adenine1618-N6)-methyltransferase